MHGHKLLLPLILILALLIPAQTHGETMNRGDRTLSPYFFVKGGDPATDRFPLKSTSVKATISGVIARVVVTQVYQNHGNRPLEAIYIFPASTRAAVHGMKLMIGDRTVTAQIEEREAARKIYDQAKQQGNRTSLLEQHRPNVFQMSVANILPGDEVSVELRYTELLVPTEKTYEFVYPTVVGPRYVAPGATDPAPEGWTQNPYLHQGETPPNDVDITVTLSTGVPLQEVNCPSHDVGIDYQGPSSARVHLTRSQQYRANRDFLLRYRLSGGRIESGLLMSEGEEENFFLLMVQPPRKVSASQVPPREYIFIVDVSGSMHGFPLEISKRLMKDLIGNLQAADRFNVVLFAGSSALLAERSLPANEANVRRAVDLMDRQRGGGGTRLLPALKRALSLPRTRGHSRSFVVITDGYVSVEAETFDLVRTHLGEANLFSFGIGSSVNRHLIEGMARVGMGEPFVVTAASEAAAKARQFRAFIQTPVLTDIQVNYGEFQVYDVEPPTIPDVMAERPVLIFGKWEGPREGILEVSGMSGNRKWIRRIPVSQVSPGDPKALPYLWARHRIALLSDYNRLGSDPERVRRVTRLGLKYSLLTAYTSFVAVDTLTERIDGKLVRVKQPLPLPHGVSDYAVGGPGRTRAELASPSLAAKAQDGTGCLQEPIRPGAAETDLRELRLVKVAVSGGLSREQVRQALEKHLVLLNACCGSGASGPVRWKGEMILVVWVGSDGGVRKVRLKDPENTQPDVGKCLVNRLRGIAFPAPQSGGPARIRLTLRVE